MIRRIPQSMPGPWQGMQRRHGELLWLPKGVQYRMHGCVPSFGKDNAIACRTRLALHSVLRAEIVRTYETGH